MRKGAGFAGVVVASVVALTGCLPVSGGGYISSVANGFKANFGFNVTCDGNTSALTGPWNYNDKGVKGVNVAGDMSSSQNDCIGSVGTQAYLSTYAVQGKCSGPHCSGIALIELYDNASAGNASMKGDCLSITLSDANDNMWYSNYDASDTQCAGDPLSGEKPLLGGNLKVG